MTEAEELLLTLGVDITALGGRMLGYCIDRLLEDPTLGDKMTERLYPEAARAMGQSVRPKSSDRPMRYEIRKAMGREDFQERVERFGEKYGYDGLLVNVMREGRLTPKSHCRYTSTLNTTPSPMRQSRG